MEGEQISGPYDGVKLGGGETSGVPVSHTESATETWESPAKRAVRQARNRAEVAFARYSISGDSRDRTEYVKCVGYYNKLRSTTR